MLTRTQTCVTLQGGQLSPIDLIVEERFHRAAPGGMGGTKAAGNYSPVRLSAAFLSIQSVHAQGRVSHKSAPT